MLLHQVPRGLEGFRLGGYNTGHQSLNLDPMTLFIILCVHVFAKVRGNRAGIFLPLRALNALFFA
jgi:hypothetical protein